MENRRTWICPDCKSENAFDDLSKRMKFSQCVNCGHLEADKG